MKKSDVAFYFVVEGARLEQQALFLASTLRDHNQAATLIAYVPETSDLAPATTRFLAACDCDIRPLRQPEGVWKKPYPHGNKIFAAAQPRDEPVSVFLDTDMIACRPFELSALPGESEVAVVPEGVASWGKDDDRWERAYAHFGLEVPTEKVRLTRGRRRLFYPYFNAGMVAFRTHDLIDGQNFGALWQATAQEADWSLAVGGKRPWLDQITLPLAIARFGFRHKVLDDVYNLPIARRAHDQSLNPVLLHYHRLRYLDAWPQGQSAFQSVIARLPSGDHAQFIEDCAATGFRPALL